MEEWQALAADVWEIVGADADYNWPVGDHAKRSLAGLVGADCANRVVNDSHLLRKALAPLLVAGGLQATETANWIVRDWGRIRRGNPDTILHWLDALGNFGPGPVHAFVAGVGVSRISSWSKILSFANSEAYAVYDSRTSVCLNLALQKLRCDRRFHIPMTQNQIIRDARASIRATHQGQWLGYDAYLGLLQALQAIAGFDGILSVEMRIFANALIVAERP